MGSGPPTQMAKIGEGDPRWIVQERADGANVNGWHWSATNVLDQAKQILDDLIEDDSTNPELSPGCRITKVDKFVGDIHTNQRKGKCKLTYDLNIHFKWVSNPPEEEESVDDHFSGVIKFAEVIDDEPDAEVTIKAGKGKAGASAQVKSIKGIGAEQCVKLTVAMLSIAQNRGDQALEMSKTQAAANSTQ